MKDSLELNSQTNTREINERYSSLKKDLMINSADDIVNIMEFNDEKNNDHDDILHNINKKDFSPTPSPTSNLILNKNKKKVNSLSPSKTFTSSIGKTLLSSVFNKQNKQNKQNNLHFMSNPMQSSKTISNELRNNFQKSLAKLNDNHTKEVAFDELKNMISDYNTQDSLRIYINLLSIYFNNCSHSAKELQVLLIGYLASIYREDLMDPLDKPPNIIKTIVRVYDIILSYMKESSVVIHKACSIAIQELFDHCMPKDDVSSIVLIFFDPLISQISSGTHKNSQTGAAVSLNDFIVHLGGKTPGEKILKMVNDKIVSVFCKTRADSQYLFQAFYNLLNLVPFENFANSLKEIYERLILILNNAKSSYQSKVICLKIFTSIAKKSKSLIHIIIGFYQNEIIFTLQNAEKDRIHKVQIAAKEALKEWNELSQIHMEMERKKMNLNSIRENELPILNSNRSENLNNLTATAGFLNSRSPNKKLEKMDKLNILRNLSKINKTNESKNEFDNNMTENLKNLKDEIYKPGNGNSNNNRGNIHKLSIISKSDKSKELSPILNKSIRTKTHCSYSPQQIVKEEIKNYLKNSQKVKKYNEENNIEDNININNTNNEPDLDFKEDVKSNSDNVNNDNLLVNKNLNKPNNKFENIKNTLVSMFNTSKNSYDNFEKEILTKLNSIETKISSSNDKINSLVKKKIKNQEIYTNNRKEFMENLKYEIKNANKKEIDTPIIKTWKQAMVEIQDKNYNNAYKQILNNGDDLYLLRLCHLTGPIFNQLTVDISRKVLLRINMISRSHHIQSLLLNLIQSSFDNFIFSKLNQTDQNEILETLYEYSAINSNIGSKAADLYIKITSN